ncbi:MAG: hypothetical protein CTY26_08520 [Methylophilus sp.]|nr:MAG: hypothetical protein CTY26_08520 [Methylophilus sp.]
MANTYNSVLDIDFGDIAWLFQAVMVRHDCVHRNGFDKDGNQQQIKNESIVELVKQCTHLVSEIEEHLISRKEKDQIKAQQSLRSL